MPGFLVPLGLDEPCAVEAFWGKLPAAMLSFGFHGALRPSARANARHKRFHTDALVQRLCLLLCEPLWPSCAVLPDSHKAPTFLSFSIGAPKKQIGGSGLLALCSSCQDVTGEACHWFCGGPLVPFRVSSAVGHAHWVCVLCPTAPPAASSQTGHTPSSTPTTQLRARNTCIGRSGARAAAEGRYPLLVLGGFGFSPDSPPSIPFGAGLGDFGMAFLSHCAAFLVPLARSMLGVVCLVLFRLLFWRLPGRATPLGFCLRFPFCNAPTAAAKSLGFASPRAAPPLVWATDGRPRRRPCARCGPHRLERLCVLLSYAFGLTQFPLHVWGMPQDAIAAVREVAALASDAPEHPPGPTSASASDFGPPLQWPLPGQTDLVPGLRVQAVVMGPGYRSLDVPLAAPLEVDADLLCHRVSAAIPDGDRLRDSIIVPACRQLHAGSLLFLQVPSWVAFSAKRAVVVDLTAFSEPVFSAFVPAELDQEVLDSIAAEHKIEPWEVYLDGSYLPMSPRAHVSMGSVLKFRPVACPPVWEPSLCAMLSDEDFFPSEPPPYLFGADAPSWLHLRADALSVMHYDGDDPAALRGRAAERMHSRVEDIRFVEPRRPITPAVLQGGRCITGVLAAAPVSAHGELVFIDARHVDRGLSLMLLEAGRHAVDEIAHHLSLDLPGGFEVRISQAEGASQVDVCDGTTLTVFASLAFSPEQGTSSVSDIRPASPAGDIEPGEATTGGQDDACSVAAEMRIIHFAIFAPSCTPELVEIELDFPASEEEALEILSFARDSRDALRFPYVVPAAPQPHFSFGSFLALPEWAQDRVVVLVDTRAVDNRLFALATDAWLQWGSFCLQAGLADDARLDIYIKEAQVVRGRPLVLEQGDLVAVLPRGTIPPQRPALTHMLCRSGLWASSPPPLDVSGCNAFLVLTDGLPRLLQVDRSIIHNSEDFRQAASLALGCSLDALSCKVSKPRITDCSHYGTPCQAVVVATTALCRVPIPPGRPTAPQVLVFFDLRTVLQGFTWQIFDNYLLCLASLEARFGDGAPVGYQVCVHGGEPELHQGSTHLRVSFGTMLWVEYAPCTDPDSAGHLEPSGDSTTVPRTAQIVLQRMALQTGPLKVHLLTAAAPHVIGARRTVALETFFRHMALLPVLCCCTAILLVVRLLSVPGTHPGLHCRTCVCSALTCHS